MCSRNKQFDRAIFLMFQMQLLFVQGVNIAYGKPATQGPGTYNNRLSSGIIQNYTANLAVDGHTSGRFEDLSCTHTKGPSSANAYWKVDLQKAYKITGMIIYNREGKTG